MIKMLKSLFSPKKIELPPFDIDDAKSEEDYWNAAWNVHKELVACQFVESSQDKDFASHEETVAVPYLTDANYYELSACITQLVSEQKETKGEVSERIGYVIQPSVFTLASDKEKIPQLGIKREFNYNVASHIGAPHNSIEEGDDYQFHYTFFKPKVYLMTTDLIGLQLALPPDWGECQTLFVIDKVWVCEKITGTMKVVLPQGEKLDMKYLAEAGKGNYPEYGIPVCFSMTEYQLDANNTIQLALKFKQKNMRDAEWQKKSARDTKPINTIIEEGNNGRASYSGEDVQTSTNNERQAYTSEDIKDIIGN